MVLGFDRSVILALSETKSESELWLNSRIILAAADLGFLVVCVLGVFFEAVDLLLGVLADLELVSLARELSHVKG